MFDQALSAVFSFYIILKLILAWFGVTIAYAFPSMLIVYATA